MNQQLPTLVSSKLNAKDDEVLFVALGGIGEIGMNLYCYGHAGRWLLVDFGVTFADHHAPGIDIITANIAFLEDNKDNIEALVLTHAHEDHLGALPYLWDLLEVPVYATPFGAAMARTKLQQSSLAEAVDCINIVEVGSKVQLGPFDVTFHPMSHSTLEACALIIDTGIGRLFHTGDWKNDPSPQIGQPIDEEKLRALGEEGMLAVIGDSTNAMEAGVSGSEQEVANGLIKAVEACKGGRAVVTCFATNVARMQSAMRAAEVTGRRVAVAGRSIHRVLGCAREAGYLQDMPPLVPEEKVAQIPRDELLLICTGSQGEGRAALARIAQRKHNFIDLKAGDSVIFSSKTIPGNENDVARVENKLAALGINLIDNGRFKVHCTGHPRRDELRWLLRLLRPQILVPCHGERRHLNAHADLARQEGIPHTPVVVNGQVLRLDREGCTLMACLAEHGRWGVDGERLVDLQSSLFKERKRLMHNGIIHLATCVNSKGAIVASPKVFSLGVFDWDVDETEIIGEIEEEAWKALERLSKKERRNDKNIEETIRRALRGFLIQAIGRKPLIEITVSRCD